MDDKVYVEGISDLELPEPKPGERTIEIPAWLLYQLADDSPLLGGWGLRSMQEKLESLFGPVEFMGVREEEKDGE